MTSLPPIDPVPRRLPSLVRYLALVDLIELLYERLYELRPWLAVARVLPTDRSLLRLPRPSVVSGLVIEAGPG